MNVRAQRSRAGEHGGIFGGLLWLILVGGIIYLAVAYLPAYFQYYEVKRVVAEAANRARSEPSDVPLRAYIIDRCADLGSHVVVHEGQAVEVPDVDLDADDVDIDRDDDPPQIEIRVDYTKMITFPFTHLVHAWPRTVYLKQDLKPVKW